MRPIFTLSIMLSVFIASCGMCTYHNSCPGYSNPAFFHWFPYSPGQVLVFKNSLGARDTITINSLDTSAGYSFTSKSPNEECRSSVDILSSEFYSPNLHKLGLHELNETEFLLDLFNSTVDANGVISYAGVSPNIRYWTDSLVTNFTLSTAVFDTLQILKNTDTTSAKGVVSAIYLAPGRGIVAYELFSGNERWLLQ